MKFLSQRRAKKNRKRQHQDQVEIETEIEAMVSHPKLTRRNFSEGHGDNVLPLKLLPHPLYMDLNNEVSIVRVPSGKDLEKENLLILDNENVLELNLDDEKYVS